MPDKMSRREYHVECQGEEECQNKYQNMHIEYMCDHVCILYINTSQIGCQLVGSFGKKYIIV